jgi:hypothetical protein
VGDEMLARGWALPLRECTPAAVADVAADLHPPLFLVASHVRRRLALGYTLGVQTTAA